MPEEPRWSPLVHAVFDGALMATGRCHAIPTGYAGKNQGPYPVTLRVKIKGCSMVIRKSLACRTFGI